MNIVFVSNFFNHHQEALSDELYRITDKKYSFVFTEEIPEERKSLGYKEIGDKPYIRDASEINNLISSADVVIAGSAPEKYIKNAIDKNKLVFRYSERPLRKGLQISKYIPRLIRWNYRNPFWKKIYLLSASAYAPGDYKKFGLFRNKAFKWGYFPETVKYENEDILIDNKKKNSILWAGRLLELKHPDEAVEVARMLRSEGYNFELNIIGTGEMENELRKMISENDLEEYVHLLGAMTPEEVRTHMERSSVFLFTSDKREGWGAVLNEAMNSGCAVVASHEIGAVPYMVKDSVNGLIYKSRDTIELFRHVKYLLDDPEKAEKMGKEAYLTIINEWNAETAARRLIDLSEALLSGADPSRLYDSGPCSPAEIISESWYSNEIVNN